MAQKRSKREAKRKAKKKKLRVLQSRPARPRACGGCTECCTHFHIRDLPDYGDRVKPAGESCRHLTDDREARCGIYPDRPKACSSYRCLWLREGAFKKRTIHHDERPDLLGIIFDLAGPAHPAVIALKKPIVVARPVWDGALEEEEALEVYDRFMAKGLVIAMIRGPKDYKFLAADPRDANAVAKVYKDLPNFKVID